MTDFSKNYTDNVDESLTFEPSNNVEKMLAKIAGEDVDIPTPTNGLEAQLKKIAEKEPSGGGGGESPIYLVRFSLDPETNKPTPTYPGDPDIMYLIEEAMQKGQVVMCLYTGDVFGSDENEFGYLPLTSYYQGAAMVFSGTRPNGNIDSISWEERGGWTASTFTAQAADDS